MSRYDLPSRASALLDPLEGSSPPSNLTFGAALLWENRDIGPGGLQNIVAQPFSLREYEPGLVPPPLPRVRPIPLPSEGVEVVPVLSSSHSIAVTKGWNVLSPTPEFLLLASAYEPRAMGQWYNEDATIPGRESFTIMIEANDWRVHGLSFTVNASREYRNISIWDVLGCVQRQCAWIARGYGIPSEGGWRWGGLKPGEEERVAVLILHDGVLPTPLTAGTIL